MAHGKVIVEGGWHDGTEWQLEDAPEGRLAIDTQVTFRDFDDPNPIGPNVVTKVYGASGWRDEHGRWIYRPLDDHPV